MRSKDWLKKAKESFGKYMDLKKGVVGQYHLAHAIESARNAHHLARTGKDKSAATIFLRKIESAREA